MPPRISFEFTDPLIENRGKPRSGSWREVVWGILYIIYSLEVGYFLVRFPWWSLWQNNYFLYRYPILQPIVTNPYLKGAVLGLGIVNLLIGLQEIARFYRKYLSH
jgi:hypothetical protein